MKEAQEQTELFTLLQRMDRMEKAHGRLFNNCQREFEDMREIITKHETDISNIKRTLMVLPDAVDVILVRSMKEKVDELSNSISSQENKILHLESWLDTVTQTGVVPTEQPMVVGNSYTRKINSFSQESTWKAQDGKELTNYLIQLKGYGDNYYATFKSQIKIKVGQSITFVLVHNTQGPVKYRLRAPKVV